MRPKKIRNRIAQELYEDRRYRLKVHNPKKKPPPEPTVEDALIELEEEENEIEKDS